MKKTKQTKKQKKKTPRRIIVHSRKLRNLKRVKITRKTRGGYSWWENINLSRYASDPEIQVGLEHYFNVPKVVGSPAKALQILEGNKNLFSSIKDLKQELGVGDEAGLHKSFNLQMYKDLTNSQRLAYINEKEDWAAATADKEDEDTKSSMMFRNAYPTPPATPCLDRLDRPEYS